MSGVIDWKAADGSADDVSHRTFFWKTAKTRVLKLFVSHLLSILRIIFLFRAMGWVRRHEFMAEFV